jgi:hypothetical protein
MQQIRELLDNLWKGQPALFFSCDHCVTFLDTTTSLSTTKCSWRISRAVATAADEFDSWLIARAHAVE